jgi:hypothetical protein
MGNKADKLAKEVLTNDSSRREKESNYILQQPKEIEESLKKLENLNLEDKEIGYSAGNDHPCLSHDLTIRFIKKSKVS